MLGSLVLYLNGMRCVMFLLHGFYYYKRFSTRGGNLGSWILVRYTAPRGSYPAPSLGRLLFKITYPNHKTRYPKKGVGYEPLGNVEA